MKKCINGKSVTFDTPAELVVVRQGLDAYCGWIAENREFCSRQPMPGVYDKERLVCKALLEAMPNPPDKDLLESLEDPVSVELTPIEPGGEG